MLIGVGSHAWRPAEPSAEALALLAGGALVVTAWAAPRWTRPSESSANERSLALAGALLGAAALTLAAAALAWRAAPTAAALSARTWLSGLRVVLTSIGLGGWLAVCAGSVWGLWLASRHGEFPTAATDRGRPAALFSYPWLTAALLAAVAWNLAAHATILALQPGDLWPLVAWLLGAIYLHATSTWRPRRVAAWLATVACWLGPCRGSAHCAQRWDIDVTDRRWTMDGDQSSVFNSPSSVVHGPSSVVHGPSSVS